MCQKHKKKKIKFYLLHSGQQKQYLNKKKCQYLYENNSFSEDTCKWQLFSSIPYIQMTQCQLQSAHYACHCYKHKRMIQQFHHLREFWQNSSVDQLTFVSLFLLLNHPHNHHTICYAGMAMQHADLQMCQCLSRHPSQHLAIPSS